MKQKIKLKPFKQRLAQRYLGVTALGTALATSPVAFAQQETETSPIVETVLVTAAVQPSCAFWLDRTWMTLGVYEGDALVMENAYNMRCSVLPDQTQNDGFTGAAVFSAFAPACLDAGENYVPTGTAEDPLNPRTMLLLNGDPSNMNHRLNYNVFAYDHFNQQTGPGQQAMGTGRVDAQGDAATGDSSLCREANPAANFHPGRTSGFAVGPGGARDEMPNQTYSNSIFFYVYPSSEQPGTPVQGNYSDTLTFYFVFRDP
ncbi:MAG: hypothetical protein VX599_03730 [Pseudomonadota bacterium]|nr:hypothetical protein [Pseudomonadota bacterium]